MQPQTINQLADVLWRNRNQPLRMNSDLQMIIALMEHYRREAKDIEIEALIDNHLDGLHTYKDMVGNGNIPEQIVLNVVSNVYGIDVRGYGEIK